MAHVSVVLGALVLVVALAYAVYRHYGKSKPVSLVYPPVGFVGPPPTVPPVVPSAPPVVVPVPDKKD